MGGVMGAKEEFPALLEPGVHSYTLDELSKLTVEKFDSVRREELYKNLCLFSQELESTGIAAKLWVDGSFLTQKPDPNDIDLVVMFCPKSVDALPPDSQRALVLLLDNQASKARFSLDVYCIDYNNAQDCSYWRGWLGFHRDGITAKGFVAIGACP